MKPRLAQALEPASQAEDHERCGHHIVRAAHILPRHGAVLFCTLLLAVTEGVLPVARVIYSRAGI